MTRLEKCKLAVEKGFTYNGLTGDVISPTGVICTKTTKNGYIQLTVRCINGFAYYLSAHQFAYWVIHNEIVDCIDHINGIKKDNRGFNLRSVTKSQNAMNMRNTKGYYFSKRSNRWIARIMLNYKGIQLGVFKTEEEARRCYLDNKSKYHII